MNNQCTCITCKYVRQMEILIPDKDLRLKVMALTEGFYEAMVSEGMNKDMEIIRLKKELKNLKKKV